MLSTLSTLNTYHLPPEVATPQSPPPNLLNLLIPTINN